MVKKRIMIVSIMFLFVIAIITVRLAYLLLSNTEGNEYTVNDQVTSKSVLFYPRGKIYDRNLIALSGKIEDDTLPIEEYTATIAKDIIGELSYDENNTTIEGIKGISGLQEIFDSELNGGLPLKIAMYKDALGTTINNGNILVYGDHPNTGISLQTTLDYHIQKLIEEEIEIELNNNNYKGIGVVVTDVTTGEILGMDSVGDHTNKTVLCYQPGSIFKILVAAKALELGVVNLDTIFECQGTIEIDGNIKHCYKDEGHGEITLLNAFAQSCNVAFYQIAMLLNDYDENGNIVYNKVLDLAKEFGFQVDNEEKSEEFLLSYNYSFPIIPSRLYNKMDVFNVALGEGLIMASPLTLTKIVATIANDGVLMEPSIISKQLDANGNILEESITTTKRIFNSEVNDKLKLLLEEVCKTGTGKDNSIEQYGGMAGKSGTAQHVSDKENHAWFAGYFPADDPKYAMTVFVEEGGTSTEVALPLYDSLAQKILNLYP
ncbi:MAG: peptidoglycan D,D-transpeptidase FtsI family protein [Eubacteriaceae bacterium]